MGLFGEQGRLICLCVCVCFKRMVAVKKGRKRNFGGPLRRMFILNVHF